MQVHISSLQQQAPAALTGNAVKHLLSCNSSSTTRTALAAMIWLAVFCTGFRSSESANASAVVSSVTASVRTALTHLRSGFTADELCCQVWCSQDGCKSIRSSEALDLPRLGADGMSHHLHHFLACLCCSSTAFQVMQASFITVHAVCKHSVTPSS